MLPLVQSAPLLLMLRPLSANNGASVVVDGASMSTNNGAATLFFEANGDGQCCCLSSLV